jgi:hypothetical protein
MTDKQTAGERSEGITGQVIEELDRLLQSVGEDAWTWDWNGDTCAIAGVAIILGDGGDDWRRTRAVKGHRAGLIVALHNHARGLLAAARRVAELEQRLDEFLTIAGATIRDGELVFSSAGYGAWTRRKGTEEHRRVLAERDDLRNLLKAMVIRAESLGERPHAYCGCSYCKAGRVINDGGDQ